MPGLHFDITGDNRGFIKSMDGIRASVRGTTMQIESTGNTIDSFFNNMGSGLNRIALLSAGAFSVGKMVEFGRECINVRGQIESLEKSFTTLLGSEEKGLAMVSQIKEFAVNTPMDMSTLAQGAQTMLAFNIEAEKVMPTLRAIGDISMGDAQKFSSLSLAFSQMSATGKLMGQDLLQMINAGFNPLAEISAKTGKSIGDLKEEMEKGKISVQMVTDAFMSATAEGGKFHGMLASQAEGIMGAQAYLRGAIADMMNDVGSSLEELAVTGINTSAELVKNYKEVGETIAVLISMYGAYRTAIIVNSAMEIGAIASTTTAYKTETAALEALLPVKQQSVNLDIKEAVAKGRLSAAAGERLISLRAEIQAQIEQLSVNKATAVAEANAAAQKYRAALQQSLAAKAAVAAKREELMASHQIVGSYISENAIKEMGIVTDKAKAAAIQSTAAKQEYYAAMSKKRIAVEALENATINVNTATQNLNASSTSLLTVAKERLSIATKKLYAAMTAHPYGILLAAVVALGYGIYKLTTYQTEAEKAQKRLNESFSKSQGAIQSESIQIKAMFDRLIAAKEGTEGWEKARNAIWSKYGQYLKSLGDEKTALNDVAAAYALVRSEADKAARARAMDAYMQSEGDIYAKKFSETYDALYEVFSKKKGKDFADAYSAEISKVLSGQAKFTDEFLAQFDEAKIVQSGGQFGASSRTYNFNAVKYQLSIAKKNAEEYQKILANGEKRFGLSVEPEKEPNETETQISLKDEYEKAQKEYAKAKSEVDKINKNRASYTKEQYKDAVETLKSAKEAFEKLGGSAASSESVASKTKMQGQKLVDLMKSQAEERLRAEQGYEYERWQSRIDLMAEGEQKVLAQMALDNDKERTALKQQQQQAINDEIARQKAVFDARQDVYASKDKKYAKEVFDPSTNVDQSAIDAINARYDQLHADLEAKQAKAEQDRLDAAKEAMNAYLQEFGSYQQKRLALQEEYDNKIEAAQSEGERMLLVGQRNKALADLDYSEWVDTGEIALAFGDISKLSDSTIEQLIADMERYREKVIATFDPDKIKQYEDALAALRDVKISDSFGIFASVVPEYFRQRKSVGSQLSSAGTNVDALFNERKNLHSQRIALEALRASGMNVTKQLAEVNAQLAANDAAVKKARNAFRLLQEQWDALDAPDAKLYGVCDAVAQTADMVQGLTGNLSGMLDAMGVDAGVVDTFGQVLGGVKDIASGFANGGIVGGIAAAGGALMGLVGSIFSAGDRKHQRNIERLQEQIDALQKSYDKLGRSADDAFSTDASHLIEQQNTLLEQQKVLIKQQMAEEDAKKNTDSDKIKDYKDRLEEIDETLADNKKKAKEAIIGEDISSAISEFSEAYASAWDNGADAAQKSVSAVKSIITSALTELLNKRLQPTVQKFYDTLAKAMEDGILSDSELAALDSIKAQMDAMAAMEEEQYKKIQDRYRDLDEIKEELTDISFDSVRDNFKSQLLDMKADTSDFAESFTDMIRSAMVEGLMDNKYDAMLKEWYDEFAKAMDDQTLTSEERDALRQQYESMISQGIADRDALNNIVGGGSYSQEASQGGWATIGQDTGEELNGRFTAMVELQAIGNDLQATQNAIAMQMLATLQSMSMITGAPLQDDSTLLAIKDMMFLSTGYLEDIARYTKKLNSVDERLATLNSIIDRKL